MCLRCSCLDNLLGAGTVETPPAVTSFGFMFPEIRPLELIENSCCHKTHILFHPQEDGVPTCELLHMTTISAANPGVISPAFQESLIAKIINAYEKSNGL